MPRIEKGSRARGLPARIQAQVQNQWRPPSVIGRVNSLGQQRLVFNDTDAIDLQTTRSINLPSGLPVGSKYLTSELATTLTTTGVVQRSVADKWMEPSSPTTSSYLPFSDHSNPEADAISNGSSFYATGSEPTVVGEGFSSPLWSKTKFEIDITPSSDSSFGIQNYTSGSNNHVMAYWNKDLRVYQGVDSGLEFAAYAGDHSLTGLTRFLSEKAIGFGAVLDQGAVFTPVSNASRLVCNPISNFGFPTAAKYEATSSCLIPMNRYISEPFLLEKIVLFYSGALNYHKYIGSYACITTFFVLNQRKAKINNFEVTQTYNSQSISRAPFSISGSNIDSGRDLVTWLQISKNAASGDENYNFGLRREATYNSLFGSLPLRREFSNQFIVSGVVKSPIKYDQGYNIVVNATFNVNTKTAEYTESLNFSGRNLTGDNGRSFLNPNASPIIAGSASFSSFWTSPQKGLINETYNKTNPYLLLPSDNLIFGWQLPYSNLSFNETAFDDPLYDGPGPALTASMNGIHKVVFYGSLLRNNKEYHEAFEQSQQTDVVTVEDWHNGI